MRHVIVTRITLALVALFLVCAGLFAWITTRATGLPAEASAETAMVFERRCAQCHTSAELRQAVNSGADGAARRRELEAFLEHHGEATPREDRLILDYLTDR